MDAKPQRPSRPTRIYGDENVVAASGVQKTIHHRNKSSPALSSLLNAGGLKAAAKRTAFGDVSNISNVLRPSKDDLAVGAKATYGVSEKSVLAPQEKKTAALSRPAQRPLSLTGLKSLLNNAGHSNSQVPARKPLGETQEILQAATHAANTRKVITKKNTTVFKDNALAKPIQVEEDLSKPVAVKSSLDPAPAEHVPQLNSDVSGQVDEHLPKLRRTKSRPIAGAESGDNVPLLDLSKSPEQAPAIRSDGVYIDNGIPDQLQQYLTELEKDPQSTNIHEDAVPLPAVTEMRGNNEDLDKLRDSHVIPPAPEPSRKHRLTSISEPEEYWDEEDDEENCDDDGYVTARSCKSRGDSTTNGATTVLFPKMNQKVRKELAAAKDLVEGSRTLGDLEEESWDTTMVAEYGDEIFQYMKDLEIKMLPNAHYMDNQAEIQWSMRSVLMDWLVQVHHRFGLLPETLFLCVNYIDRFLSCKLVSLGKLQLVGATAIFVAAKYEEINCPSVQEIVYMVDNGYTVDEILKAERFMLSMLHFELGWPGPMSFLRRISKADDYDLETRTLAKYFLEITIMDERFVGSPPSFTAAGAHCLARMMLKKGNWSPVHVYYSNYTYSQLFGIVLLMVECCENPQRHHNAIYEKYSDKRFKRAALFVENEMAKGFQVFDVAANSSASCAAFVDPYDSKLHYSTNVTSVVDAHANKLLPTYC